MRMMRNLCRDRRGAAVVELAFALPALIILMWVIIQLGLVFRAMSGIKATTLNHKAVNHTVKNNTVIKAAIYIL